MSISQICKGEQGKLMNLRFEVFSQMTIFYDISSNSPPNYDLTCGKVVKKNISVFKPIFF